MLTEHDALWIERSLQDSERLSWLGIPAHEDIECGIAMLGPRMNRDVTLGQNRNARNSTSWSKNMKVDMKKRCSGGLHSVKHCCFDSVFIRKALGLPQLNN
jgi:hypothetical protein